MATALRSVPVTASRRASQSLRSASSRSQQLASAPRLTQRAVWAAADAQQQGAAAALSSSDSEVRLPWLCSRCRQLLPACCRIASSACIRVAAAPFSACPACAFPCPQDRVPPGCSRYSVSLAKPLGLVLEEGKGGRGVYVVGGWVDGSCGLVQGAHPASSSAL